MPERHIHFVCTGNVFRSRLAEAYLKSKQIKDVRVSSSGIAAHRNFDGPITWYGMRLIKKHKLVPFMSFVWTQATLELLTSTNLVVFMNPKNENDCQQLLNFSGNSLTWEIKDIEDFTSLDPDESVEYGTKVMEISQNIFTSIQKNVDQLAQTLLSQPSF